MMPDTQIKRARHGHRSISEGSGSRIRIVLNDVKAVFHRPHPRKETDKGAIVSMRRFLSEAGVALCDIKNI